MRRFLTRCGVATLLACLGTAVVCAAPQSVYGPSTPGDAAFVRILNLLPDGLRLTLGAAKIGPLQQGAISSYYAILPDIYTVRAGGAEQEVVPQSGTYLTVACSSTGITVFTDPPHTNPAKAQLFFYNMTPAAPLDLRTADGKTTVIAGVKTGESAQVVVNAVTVSLAVFKGPALVKSVGSLTLQRGASYSVFLMGDAASPSVLSAKADVKVP